MIQFFKANMEPRKRLRMVELGIAIVLCIVSVVSIGYGLFDVYGSVGNIQFVQSLEMTRDEEMEDYSEDNTICDVTYRNGDAELVVSYSYDDYMNLEEDTITAYEYENDQGMKLYFDHQDVTDAEIQ